MESASQDKDAQWLTEIPEQELRALGEYLYHSLQVRTRQDEAFNEWDVLIGQAVDNWRRQQARTFLALVRQVVEEGEPLYQRALAIVEQQLGPQLPDTATVRKNYNVLVENMKLENKKAALTPLRHDRYEPRRRVIDKCMSYE